MYKLFHHHLAYCRFQPLLNSFRFFPPPIPLQFLKPQRRYFFICCHVLYSVLVVFPRSINNKKKNEMRRNDDAMKDNCWYHKKIKMGSQYSIVYNSPLFVHRWFVSRFPKPLMHGLPVAGLSFLLFQTCQHNGVCSGCSRSLLHQ